MKIPENDQSLAPKNLKQFFASLALSTLFMAGICFGTQEAFISMMSRDAVVFMGKTMPTSFHLSVLCVLCCVCLDSGAWLSIPVIMLWVLYSPVFKVKNRHGVLEG